MNQRNMMKRLGSSLLLEYEWVALQEALKRDAGREIQLARADADFLNGHLYNARMSQRVLDVMRSDESMQSVFTTWIKQFPASCLLKTRGYACVAGVLQTLPH
jgi:hypothetical protein